MSLKARNISLRRDAATLLRGIDLTARPASITALLGPSGAGKSTLLRVLAGLERPSAGEILQDGERVNTPGHNLSPHRRGVAMIFQSLALWPHMDLIAHLDFVMDRQRYPDRRTRRTRARELLARLNLPTEEGIFPQRLSGGEQQRLAIARALAQPPAYLLMDEPFSSLDDLLREELLRLTKTLRDEHRIGIVYVTHSIDEALALADDIAVMAKGRITAQWSGQAAARRSRADILTAFR